MPGADRSCVCARAREGVWPVSQRKQSTVSTSLMKTLSVSYTRTKNEWEMCIGTIRQRKWQMKWAFAVAKAGHWQTLWVLCIRFTRNNHCCVTPVKCIHYEVFLFWCDVLPCMPIAFGFIWNCVTSQLLCWAWEDRAEDEVPFSGTLGTHLTLAYCWACSTGPEHAEVWIQKCLCVAQATRGEVGGSINISPTVSHQSRLHI